MATEEEKEEKEEQFPKCFDFDGLLQSTIGEFGLYQQVIVGLLCLPACFLSAYNSLDMVFLAYSPKHKCNSSIIQNLTSNFQSEECSFKVVTNETFLESIPKCDSWTYDTEYFERTIVTEWNLVCDNALTIRSIISFMNFATLFSIVLSVVQDRWGRKRAFVLNLSLFLLGNCSSLLAPNPYVFAFFKFIGGISCMWNICFCWALEFVGPNKRSLVTTCLCIIYAFATMSLALLGYICDTWKQLGLWTSTPFVLLFPYVCFVPESPRWLLSQGRIDEALIIVGSMAKWQKVNNVDLVKIRYDLMNYSIEQQDEEWNKKEFINFFRSTNLRWKTFLLIFASAVGTQIYTAVPYHIENLQGNFFLSFAIQAAVEAPATLCAFMLLTRCGRVVPLSISMTLAGIACILTWPAEKLGLWGGVTLSTVARFFICTSVPICTQLTNELFPTVARGVGNSIILVATNLISISIQYILYSSTIWTPLPMLIMGPVTLLGAALTLFLPDTKNLPLPDTVEEAEKQGHSGIVAFKKNFCFDSKIMYVDTK